MSAQLQWNKATVSCDWWLHCVRWLDTSTK